MRQAYSMSGQVPHSECMSIQEGAFVYTRQLE